MKEVLKIAFRKGNFISHNKVNIENFTSNKVEGNGWLCEVDNKGRFRCTTNVEGIKIKLILENSRVKRCLKKGAKRATAKFFKLKKSPTEGIIELPNTVTKEPAFKEGSIQSFVNKYGGECH